MANNTPPNPAMDQAVDVAVRLLLLGFLVYTCYQIIQPFIGLIAWGAILATAVYPMYKKLVPRLGNKQGLTATLLVIVTLLLLIVPVYEMTISFVETMRSINQRFEAGTLSIQPPNSSVADWPIIGERLFAAWSLASESLEDLVLQYEDQIAGLSQRAIGLVAGFGGTVGSFIISTIIAGAFLAFAAECYDYTVKVLNRLMDSRGQHFTDLGTATIRSVAQGVIGIALIQAIASALGLAIMDVPAYGVWVLAILVLAVVQLPPWLILGPIAVWIFSVYDTVPATIFAVYALIVSFSDAILKPMFLGRGLDIPMPVILLGAIGGLILMGILGLFIGAIVLAIGYTMFSEWLQKPDTEDPTTQATEHE